jgi:hypothetical protein
MLHHRLFGDITTIYRQGSSVPAGRSIRLNQIKGMTLGCLDSDWLAEDVLVVFALNGQAPGIGQSHKWRARE